MVQQHFLLDTDRVFRFLFVGSFIFIYLPFVNGNFSLVKLVIIFNLYSFLENMNPYLHRWKLDKKQSLIRAAEQNGFFSEQKPEIANTTKNNTAEQGLFL